MQTIESVSPAILVEPGDDGTEHASIHSEISTGHRATTNNAVSYAVVVTSYNYRDFVIEAIESILAQTLAPEQIIVVDDGSSDGSAALLHGHYAGNERVTLLIGKNEGQLGAFQRGVALVRADVVCFLDSDDCWEPEYLARLDALYASRPDIDFVFSDLQLFDQQDRVMKFHHVAVDLGYTAISTYILTQWYGAPTSALSMRTAWAQRALDLPELFQGTWRLSADNCLVFGCSILGAHKYYLPTGCVKYRIHGKNGWWSNQSARKEYVNKMTSSALIRHYAAKVGLAPECVEFAKLEFMTKPRPTWSETKRYARLVQMRRLSPWRRWERALSILGRGLKLRG